MIGLIKICGDSWEEGRTRGREIAAQKAIDDAALIAAGKEPEPDGFEMFLETVCFVAYVFVCVATIGIWFWVCREADYQRYAYRRDRYVNSK